MPPHTTTEPPRVESPDADPHRDARGALHDVSNALTVMLGWVSEARSPDASPESIAYALRIIEHRARDARDLARRAIGAEVPTGEQSDQLDGVLKDTIDSLAVEATRSGVRLSLDARTGLRIRFAGDLSQVVLNIVLNAMAHAPRGTDVVVMASKGEEEGQVNVDIEDRGPGVPAPRRDSIFEGDSKRKGGAGVGLPHARALARAAGGNVELVPSVAGACFRVTWATRDGAANVPRSTARELVLQGLGVLVIEDDADVIALLETALSARGAELSVARSRAQMDERLTARRIDAVLMDLSPIEEDIAGALATLRREAPDATLILITGAATPSIPDGIAGIRLVRKPFEVSEIVKVLLDRDD
ncbi:MAG: hybrid sensor histidine kinase/response regulator [Myxococcales bacterium]|nr:hybrid sensor histidine kinase/response regulator [Myxococcales bacterium]